MRLRWMMTKKFKSDAAAAIHETMAGLHRIGAIDKKTMRKFDASCLTEAEDLSPQQIQKLRKEAGVSQGIFAAHLNVRPTLVSAWERGERKPSGPAKKLLTLAKRKGLAAIA